MTATGHAPKVVALVPAWNAAAFIERTLDSLARQTYSNLHVLISDDASADATAAICERYAARDARFHLIRQPRNLGWVGNSNALLREASGDYFLFAYHDDYSAPAYVSRLVEVLECHPRAVLAFSDATLEYDDGRREHAAYPHLDGLEERLARARMLLELDYFWWLPVRGVFRAAAGKAVGGLRRHRAGEFSADWPWLIHLALLGEFVRVPEPLHTKTFRPGTVSSSTGAGGTSPKWDFSARSWTAVVLSAMATVERARLPLVERAVLHWRLARFAVRERRIARARARSAASLTG